MEAGIHMYSREAESQKSLDFRTASFLAQHISAKVLKSQHFVIVGKVPNFQHHVVSLKKLYLQHLIYIFCGNFQTFVETLKLNSLEIFNLAGYCGNFPTKASFCANFPQSDFCRNFFQES